MIDTLLSIFLFSFVLFINKNNKKNSNNDDGNQVLTLTLGDFLSWACLWLFLEPEEEWLPVDFARMCERWLLSDVEEDEEVESKGPDRDVFIIFFFFFSPSESSSFTTRLTFDSFRRGGNTQLQRTPTQYR